MVPGLIGLILQFQTLLLTAFAIVREREQGTLEQLIVTPIRPWELMLGKILPYCVTAFASVTLALAIGRLVFGVESRAACRCWSSYRSSSCSARWVWDC